MYNNNLPMINMCYAYTFFWYSIKCIIIKLYFKYIQIGYKLVFLLGKNKL